MVQQWKGYIDGRIDKWIDIWMVCIVAWWSTVRFGVVQSIVVDGRVKEREVRSRSDSDYRVLKSGTRCCWLERGRLCTQDTLRRGESGLKAWGIGTNSLFFLLILDLEIGVTFLLSNRRRELLLGARAMGTKLSMFVSSSFSSGISRKSRSERGFFEDKIRGWKTPASLFDSRMRGGASGRLSYGFSKGDFSLAHTSSVHGVASSSSCCGNVVGVSVTVSVMVAVLFGLFYIDNQHFEAYNRSEKERSTSYKITDGEKAFHR